MRTPRSTLTHKGSVAVPPADSPTSRGLLSLAVAVVVVSALYFARSVLIPITLAVMLSFLVAPIAGFLRRYHFGRVGSVILAMLLPLVVLIGMGIVIGGQLSVLIRDVPTEQTVIMHKVNEMRDATVGKMNSFVKTAGNELKKASKSTKAHSTDIKSPTPLPVSVIPKPTDPFQVAEGIVGPALGPLAILFVVFTVATVILLYREDLRDRMIRLFGSNDLHRTTTAIDDAVERLSRYFLTKFLINAGFGVFVGLGLFLIGVPGAILWGVVTALARFVPYIGSFIAAVPPLLLAAAVDPGWTKVFLTLALFVIGEGLVGQVLEPFMYGRTTGLSPTSVIVAAIFWGWIWGPIGLLLSTPLTLCLVVLGRHVERLEFLDVLLGDQPALTPVENFYQRALAGDSDEAIEQAEILLRERSLCSYYDGVVLPALRLAAAGAARGILYPGQLDRVSETVTELLDDLSDEPDTEKPPRAQGVERNEPMGPKLNENDVEQDRPPRLTMPAREHRAPNWQTDTPVLCIAGRGALDVQGCEIIAQLLSKHGIGVRILPHKALTRTQISDLDTEGVALIFLCYLDIASAPTSLRYLARRVRNVCPALPVVAGFWTTKEDYERYAEFQTTVGANHYPTSLRDAVDAVLSEAIAAATEAGTQVVAKN